ncbi:MAG: DNA-directed RNA polymerase subunit M [Lachnospiraceae bacterium]|jgi:hypothetical protein|nr:DNA-directed RNA polymerase subunit M [Lachnospiraceae bacterium]
MMKIFICPGCGRMTVGSRKKEVYCSKCDEVTMMRAKLTFKQYTAMTEEQRKDYAQSWLYIHNAAKRK